MNEFNKNWETGIAFMYQLPVKQVKTKIMLLHNKVDVTMIDLYNKMFVKYGRYQQ